MEAVNNLNKEMTIIIIAHRLNTVKNCDNIIVLANGEIKEKGPYEKLVKNSNFFEVIANDEKKIIK